MKLTVKQALETTLLQSATLLAGKKGLSKGIEWVNVNEIIDEFGFFKKGEFFITTGFNLQDADLLFIEKMAKRLKSSGVAAIAIQKGYYVETIPEELIKLCDTLHLPLIELPKTLSFSVLMRDIFQEILAARIKELEHSKKINEKLTALVFKGKGLSEVAALLSALLNAAVEIGDEKENVVALSGQKNDPLEPSTNSLAGPGPGTLPQGPEVIFEQVVIDGDKYGHIAVEKSDENPFTDLDRITIATAKTVVGLIMLNERSLLANEERLRGDLLDDMIEGNCSEETVLKRFRYLGYPHRDYVIYIVDAGVSLNLSSALKHLNADTLNKSLHSIIKRYLDFENYQYLLKTKGERVICLIHLKSKTCEATIKNLFKEMQRAAKNELSLNISIGFGSKCRELSCIRDSFNQADRALKIGKHIWGKNYLAGYEELGIYRLFVEGTNKEELQRQYDHTVGIIKTYDESHDTDLYNTLKTYYECDKGILSTAEKLFIHRHTLRYRLARIKSLTGLDPDKSQDSLQLQVGILVSYLLQNQNGQTVN